MRTYLNSNIYNALPTTLWNAIIDTAVIAGHGSTKGETNFTSIDKLYLLSTKEVWNGGTGYDTAEVETRQLDYYLNNYVTISRYYDAVKLYNGNTIDWWLRNSTSSNTYCFSTVSQYGDKSNRSSTEIYSVSPAFRLV